MTEWEKTVCTELSIFKIELQAKRKEMCSRKYKPEHWFKKKHCSEQHLLKSEDIINEEEYQRTKDKNIY
jgi:hypothetical protein